MADISKITQGTTTYNLADTDARSALDTVQAVLNTDRGVQVTMYTSEASLPQAVDLEHGVFLGVGTIAYCVQESSWHRVSSIATGTGAITWDDTFDPHISSNVDLSAYSKNLIIDKAENITDAQKEEYDTFDTTDNECGMVFGEVAEGDHNAVDGDTVYKALPIFRSITWYESVTLASGATYDGNQSRGMDISSYIPTGYKAATVWCRGYNNTVGIVCTLCGLTNNTLWHFARNVSSKETSGTAAFIVVLTKE